MQRIIAILFLFFGACTVAPFSVFASEINCTLGSAATSTGCVAVLGTGFVVFTPSATPAAGTYNAVQSVSLAAEGATNIRYTADGATPSCSSGVLYAAPISVKKTQTVKAIACYPQSTESAAASFQYLLSIFDASGENAVPTTSAAGAASLPTQATSIRLSNTTAFDVSAAVATTSAGQITVGGALRTLSSFTRGNLTAVNLSAPVAVGGRAISVEKAVAIQSGVSGEPILLSNQDFSVANVSIPDGAAVLAPSGWSGTLAPPRAGARSGTPPSGFSIGGTVVEIGSATEVLLFDTPVSVVLSGITGSVGYKASGATEWVQIANQCGGSYSTPSAPVFPGECYLSNGSDTKIYTYHLTSFAGLDAEISGVSATPQGGNGPVGGGASAPLVAGDANGDGRRDLLDFNLLLALWGTTKTGPFYSSVDFNRDGAVDVLDFTLLLAHWK